MNAPFLPDDSRLLELLADRAVDGLDDALDRELATLLVEDPYGDYDPSGESLEYAAAAALLASTHVDEELPASIQSQILSRWSAESGAPSASSAPVKPRVIPGGAAPKSAPPPRGGSSLLAWTGWLAAAAAIVFGVVDWGPAAPSREAVVAMADTGRWDWTWNEAGKADEKYREVTGRAHWNQRLQKGWLEFRGLPLNDPAVRQYQLWIVDPERDQEPVDGGVFDVKQVDETTGTVWIEIQPTLEIVDPKAFAITVEQPGGVVVSEGPIHLVAAVE